MLLVVRNSPSLINNQHAWMRMFTGSLTSPCGDKYGDGITLISKRHYPDTAIIVLTMNTIIQRSSAVLDLDIEGIVLKQVRRLICRKHLASLQKGKKNSP